MYMLYAPALYILTRYHTTHFCSCGHPGWLQIWDLGGQQNLRPFWATYYKNCDAVIMVVDSTDRARVGITRVRGHRGWGGSWP